MSKIKVVTLYAEAIRWVSSEKYLGKSSKNKPVIFMDTENCESYCRPQLVGRERVKLNHWYEIDRKPASNDKNLDYQVHRIIPHTHLTPEEYEEKHGNKEVLPPPEPPLQDEILKLLKRHIALRSRDIYEILSGNTKRESDYTIEERKKYKEIGTFTRRMHNEGTLFCLAITRNGKQGNASHVFFGLDADSVLSKIEFRGHLKLVQEPIHSLKGTKWESLGGK